MPRVGLDGFVSAYLDPSKGPDGVVLGMHSVHKIDRIHYPFVLLELLILIHKFLLGLGVGLTRNQFRLLVRKTLDDVSNRLSRAPCSLHQSASAHRR